MEENASNVNNMIDWAYVIFIEMFDGYVSLLDYMMDMSQPKGWENM